MSGVCWAQPPQHPRMMTWGAECRMAGPPQPAAVEEVTLGRTEETVSVNNNNNVGTVHS